MSKPMSRFDLGSLPQELWNSARQRRLHWYVVASSSRRVLVDCGGEVYISVAHDAVFLHRTEYHSQHTWVNDTIEPHPPGSSSIFYSCWKSSKISVLSLCTTRYAQWIDLREGWRASRYISNRLAGCPEYAMIYCPTTTLVMLLIERTTESVYTNRWSCTTIYVSRFRSRIDPYLAPWYQSYSGVQVE